MGLFKTYSEKEVKRVRPIVEKINREDKITIIMISHDIKAAMKYASHILHIGEKVFYGTKQEYERMREGVLFD